MPAANGINVYRVDRRTGAFAHVPAYFTAGESVIPGAERRRPTPFTPCMAIAQRRRPFRIDERTGKLTIVNRQPTGGYNPVHLAFDRTGRYPRHRQLHD